MALPKLAQALAAAGGDPEKAAAIARSASSDAMPHGGHHYSFISLAANPEPDPVRRSDALLGCVFSAKDNIDAAGFTTTCGSRLFVDAPPATTDSWIVARLKQAGAQCIGKNNMHEFALGATGINKVFGNTVNPWDKSRNVGGSSGGSAGAVALRQVHLSIGTDSGGSVRMPAAFTGITGYKPTPGILPMDGVAGEAWSIDCLGLFTTTVADLTTIWRAIVPNELSPARRRLRLAYLNDDSMGRADPIVWDQYQATVERLRKGGAELTAISIPGFGKCPYVCISIVYPEVASAHYELMRARPHEYDQHIRSLICLGELWSSRNYLDAQRLRSVLRERFAGIIAPYDAVLTPTVPIQPPRNGEPAHVPGDPPTQSLYTLIRFTVAFNVIGYPAISVPSGLDRDGLPSGLQIIGKPGGDWALLDVSQCVEDVLGVMPAPSANFLKETSARENE
jgi:aspartyl-tRNA(Asn)/glutamyl-tRNA(Gln) amidotransferase subunit A